MISVGDREQIRRAYFVEHKSIRRIAAELGHSRDTVNKALRSAEGATYRLREPRTAPVLGAYKARIDTLLAEEAQMPAKQRFTSHKIYELIEKEGYGGAESSVRADVGRQRQAKRRPAVFLPLEFDPGTDAQVDWGEAMAIIGGEEVTVQLFFMRLCYSRRLFVRAYPSQKQESFLDGHVHAFHFFQGVPHRIAYDNLKAAVKRILEGRNRQEQETFIVFRSHYLYESRFCTPGQGHEKGGVEGSVGFGRRNYLVPIPQVASFDELNAHLLAACLADDQRKVDGQPTSIGAAWQAECGQLLPLPARDFDCCVVRPVCLTPYSQVEFETNRYSVPVDEAQPHLTLKAYPFRIEILNQEKQIACHPRCYGRKQEVCDPLHYLPLLAQRPGAFEHAKPLRRWREEWPAVYEQLLARLQASDPEDSSQGIREFVRILQLHTRYPAHLIEQAITQALQHGCVRADGVELCLRQLLLPELNPPSLDLIDHPQLMGIGTQELDLHRYEQLLGGS